MACKVIAISAGEGGIVITNSDEVYNRIIYLSHLNRKSPNNDRTNLLSKIGFIEGRMNPLGAVTAINDIKNLKNRNNILRKKIKILYSELKNSNDIEIPEIKNFDNLGGFIMVFLFSVIRNN